MHRTLIQNLVFWTVEPVDCYVYGVLARSTKVSIEGLLTKET